MNAAMILGMCKELFCDTKQGRNLPLCTARERESGTSAARMWTMQGVCNLCPRMLKRPSKLLEQRDF